MLLLPFLPPAPRVLSPPPHRLRLHQHPWRICPPRRHPPSSWLRRWGLIPIQEHVYDIPLVGSSSSHRRQPPLLLTRRRTTTTRKKMVTVTHLHFFCAQKGGFKYVTCARRNVGPGLFPRRWIPPPSPCCDNNDSNDSNDSNDGNDNNSHNKRVTSIVSSRRTNR